MTALVPTPSQLAALTSAKNLADAGVQGADEKIAGYDQAIAAQQEIDDFMRATFEYYSDNIIRKYEIEKRKLNGYDIASPIIEQDLLDFASKDTECRLWNGTNLEPKRIAEFDGGPLVLLDQEGELVLFGKQDTYLSELISGVPGQVLLSSTLTTTDLTSSSTSLSVLSTDPLMVVNPNDVILITSGSDAAIVKVDSVAGGGSCAGETPPGSGTTKLICETNGGTWTPGPYTLGITIILPPIGTILAGAAAGAYIFSGFNNSERTTKIASQGWAQPIMTTLVSLLTTEVNSRKTSLQTELSSVQTNQDPGLNPLIVGIVNGAITRVNSLLGIDISDTGIANFNNDKDLRIPEISARVSEIPTAITAGDFYNMRYSFSTSRAQLANGSLSMKLQLQDARQKAIDSKGAAQGLSDRYAPFV